MAGLFHLVLLTALVLGELIAVKVESWSASCILMTWK